MAERIEQGAPETHRGDNHLYDHSFIETAINCDRLVVSSCLLAKLLIIDRNLL